MAVAELWLDFTQASYPDGECDLFSPALCSITISLIITFSWQLSVSLHIPTPSTLFSKELVIPLSQIVEQLNSAYDRIHPGLIHLVLVME